MLTQLSPQTSFAFNTLIGQVTPIAVTSIGWRYYLVFIIFNLTSALFFWAFLPETKGLSLEDMDELFNDSPTFIPGSHWTPSSNLDNDAEKFRIGSQGQNVGVAGAEAQAEALAQYDAKAGTGEHVDDVTVEKF